jgi:hypothetical protein
VLAGDLHRFELPNGYWAQVVTPLECLRIGYRDEQCGNAFEIEFEALAEPMVLETGFHLEQPMRARGALTLRGTEYVVDGYNVRDRSWGQLRSQAHVYAPPMGWMTAVFGDDLMFGATAFDSEDRDPEWKGAMSLPGGDALRGGWIRRDGEYRPVVSASKRTFRNEDTLFPEAVELTVADAAGFSMELRGTVTAASDWRAWNNMNSVICLVRWELGGRVGYGDLQEVQFQDYIRRFAGDLSGRGAVVAT